MEVENRIFHDGMCGPDVVPAKEIHPIELVPYLDVHEDVMHEHMDARSVLADDLVVEVIAGRWEFLFNLVRRTYHKVGMVLFGQSMQVAQAVGCHQVVRIEEIEILASGLFEGYVARQSRSHVPFLPQDSYAMAPGMRGHQMLHDVDAPVGAAVVDHQNLEGIREVLVQCRKHRFLDVVLHIIDGYRDAHFRRFGIIGSRRGLRAEQR